MIGFVMDFDQFYIQLNDILFSSTSNRHRRFQSDYIACFLQFILYIFRFMRAAEFQFDNKLLLHNHIIEKYHASWISASTTSYNVLVFNFTEFY